MRKLVLWSLAGVLMTLALMVGSTGGHAQLQPPPPPPPPGGYPTPTPAVTPTATITPTATPTATPVPLSLSVKLAHSTVNPGSQQSVSISTLRGAKVQTVVFFPNGDKKKHNVTAGSSGKINWSYKQPGSRITHSSRTAKVTVSSLTGSSAKYSTKKYTIGFARLDVSALPRRLARGKLLSIWVHTRANDPIEVVLRFSGGGSASLTGRTGNDGWAYLRYTVPKNARTGRVEADGYSLMHGYPGSGITSFQVT